MTKSNRWKDLEKENAELKEKVKWYSEQVCFKECAEVWGKAKEIIKDLLEYNKEHWLYSDIKKQAEQFIKECE